MNDDVDLRTFVPRFFALSGALGAVINYGRTQAIFWIFVALVAAELARTYAPKGEKGRIRSAVRDFWYWSVYEDPRWRNVPMLAAARDRLLSFRLRLRPIGAVAALLLLLVPLGAAQPFPSGDELNDALFGPGKDGETRRYQIEDHTSTDLGGFTDNLSFLKLHTWDLGPTSPVLVFDVKATYTIRLENDGVWRYSVSLNGTEIPDCNWQIPTASPGGFLDGDLVVYPHVQTTCTVGPDITAAFAESQVVNYTVSRTTLSGTPDPPIAALTNVKVDRVDFVVLDMEVEITNLWVWVPLFVGLALLVVGENKRDFMYRGISGLLLMASGLIAIQEGFAWYVAALFMAAGMYLILQFMISDQVAQKIRRS